MTETSSSKMISNLKNAIVNQHLKRAELEYKTVIRAVILEKFPELLPTYLNNTDIIIPAVF